MRRGRDRRQMHDHLDARERVTAAQRLQGLPEIGDTLPGIEVVVHLAAIPSPAHATANQIFATNVSSTHAVFAAAQRLGLQRVVWASSETTLGLPFDTAPDY